jgi:hypothetical protein
MNMRIALGRGFRAPECCSVIMATLLVGLVLCWVDFQCGKAPTAVPHGPRTYFCFLSLDRGSFYLRSTTLQEAMAGGRQYPPDHAAPVHRRRR